MKNKSPKRRLVLGLTGCMLSGKSSALAAFAAEGALTLSADQLAHEALVSRPVQKILKEEFGSRDASVLAAQVFKNARKRKRLEAVIHPRVLKKARALIKKSSAPLVVFEVPLLFEAGWNEWTDLTLLVRGGQKGLDARLKERGVSRADYEARLKTQLPDEEKARLADLVIVNDSTKQNLEQKVRRLARALIHIYG